MDLNERAAYLKGLMDGLEIDEGKKEGKVLKAMYELLAQPVSYTHLDVYKRQVCSLRPALPRCWTRRKPQR